MLEGGVKGFSAFRPIGLEAAVLSLWSEENFFILLKLLPSKEKYMIT